MTTLLLGVSSYVIIFGMTHYTFATGVMPVIGGFCVAIPSLLFLPRDLHRYINYRKEAKLAASVSLRTRAGSASTQSW